MWPDPQQCVVNSPRTLTLHSYYAHVFLLVWTEKDPVWLNLTNFSTVWHVVMVTKAEMWQTFLGNMGKQEPHSSLNVQKPLRDHSKSFSASLLCSCATFFFLFKSFWAIGLFLQGNTNILQGNATVALLKVLLKSGALLEWYQGISSHFSLHLFLVVKKAENICWHNISIDIHDDSFWLFKMDIKTPV